MNTHASNSLARSTLLAYALPAIAMAMPVLPVYVLLPTFYAENTALTLLTIGTVLFVARLVDVASDALAGSLCDRSPFGTTAALGRRRGWMLIGGIVLCPALVMLFSPPSDADVGWLFVSAATLYLGWTFVQVPYLGWVSDLTPHYHERTRLSGTREALGLIGLVLSAAWPALGAAMGMPVPDQFFWLAIATCAVGIICFGWLFVKLPEPPAVSISRGRWRDMLQNRLWSKLVAAWCINGIANGIPAVLFPLFITVVLGESIDARGTYLLIYFLAAVAAMPIVFALGKRLDKHKLWCYSMLLACGVFALVPLLGEGDGHWFVLVCIATGATLGADLALPPALTADVVDWDRFRFRRESTALCFAGGSLATKLALGIAVVLAPFLLSLNEWNDDAAKQSEHAALALAMIYAWLPCVLKIGTIVLMWRYPLSATRHSAIRKRLSRTG
ncbi:MAG: MFS transporter [Pseudomonadota bacterium]